MPFTAVAMKLPDEPEVRKILNSAHAIIIPVRWLKHNFAYNVRSQVTLAGYAEFFSVRTADVSDGLHQTLKKSRRTCSYTERLKSGSAPRSTSAGITHL